MVATYLEQYNLYKRPLVFNYIRLIEYASRNKTVRE